MSAETSIAWTDHTFNPWHGCTKISDGCDNCYAEPLAHRYGHDVWGKDAPRRFLSDAFWREPLAWNRAAAAAGRPALVFCASMADVFEPRDDLDAARARLWELIDQTPLLIWQLLTKRPEQIGRLTPASWWNDWPERVWVGASAEDQRNAELRIPRLLRVPAAVRFISYEPALGPLELHDEWITEPCPECEGSCSVPVPGGGMACNRCWRGSGPTGFLEGIRWVICGAESGPQRRPFDLEWARALRRRCDRMMVPFFFKQAGGLHSGAPGPPDLEGWKQFPAEARR